METNVVSWKMLLPTIRCSVVYDSLVHFRMKTFQTCCDVVMCSSILRLPRRSAWRRWKLPHAYYLSFRAMWLAFPKYFLKNGCYCVVLVWTNFCLPFVLP